MEQLYSDSEIRNIISPAVLSAYKELKYYQVIEKPGNLSNAVSDAMYTQAILAGLGFTSPTEFVQESATELKALREKAARLEKSLASEKQVHDIERKKVNNLNERYRIAQGVLQGWNECFNDMVTRHSEVHQMNLMELIRWRLKPLDPFVSPYHPPF